MNVRVAGDRNRVAPQVRYRTLVCRGDDLLRLDLAEVRWATKWLRQYGCRTGPGRVGMDAKIIGNVTPVLELALNRGESVIAESGELS